MTSTDFQFEDISRRHPRFRVRDVAGNLLGIVEYKWFGHLRLSAWRATHANGEHRAVHEHRSQAAKALAWDGIGYPFPLKP